MLSTEKDSISMVLDETHFKILSLEKALHDKEMVLQNQQHSLDELRKVNNHLQNRLDALSREKMIESYKKQGSSLLNEMEMSSHSSEANRCFNSMDNLMDANGLPGGGGGVNGGIGSTNGGDICSQCSKVGRLFNHCLC